MKHISTKKLFIIFIFLISMLFITYNVIDYIKCRTIESAIENNFYNPHPTIKLKKILNEINVDRDTKFVFYINHANSISYGHLSKKWNGGWKVVSASGTFPLELNNVDISFFSRLFNNEIFIYGGIIYNKNTNKVFFNGIEATILNNDEDVRISYIKTDKNIHSYEIEGYNYLGKQIWNHSITQN